MTIRFYVLIGLLIWATPVFAGHPEYTIGKSVQGRPIVVHQFGYGDVALVLSGGIHGTYERNTVDLMNALVDRYETNVDIPGVTLFIVENLNPDAFANTGKKANHADGTVQRFNARGVDLNRNWDTPDWRSEQNYHGDQNYPRAGGSAPYSEPEVQAFARFLSDLRESYSRVAAINYHSFAFQDRDRGAMYPGYTRDVEIVPDEFSALLANLYAGAADYTTELTFEEYDVPGEFVHWAALQNIAAMDVELSDFGGIRRHTPDRASHLESTMAGLDALIGYLRTAGTGVRKSERTHTG